MLSPVSNTHRDISSKDCSYADDTYPPVDKTLGIEDRLCPGCKKSVVSENGGLVVAFGQSFFHVDCFKCAKCGNQVTADTNLLLLSDGSPICANCSYSCSVCHLPILDEAIMTGDDSYHAHCFKCKVCKNRIDELVFAKTTQGIYCMNCHSERMIRLRRHAQKKLERGKAAGGSKLREQEAGSTHKENRMETPTREAHPHPHADMPRSADPISSATFRSSSSALPPNDVQTPASMSSFPPSVPQVSPWSPKAHPLSVTVAPPEQYHQNMPSNPSSPRQPHYHLPPSEFSSEHTRKTEKQDTLPVPVQQDSVSASMKRRKSYDDGVRPLNLMFSPKPAPAEKYKTLDSRASDSNPSSGSSRGDRLRAKNPGLVLANFDTPSRSATTPALSPSAMTFGSRSPVAHNHDSKSPSPLGEQFADRKSGGTPFVTPLSTPSTGDFLSMSPPADFSGLADPQTPVSRGRHGYTSPSANDPDHTTPTRGPRSPAPTDKQSARLSALGLNASLKGSLNPANIAPLQRNLSPSLTINGQMLHPSLDNRPRSFYDARRLSSNPNADLARSRSPSKSRPDSPAHRADVPHNIESGTDTESETGHSQKSISDQERILPLASPIPKVLGSQSLEVSTSDIDPDLSSISQTNSADGSDDMLESSPVEGTSHSTFIAPALPPIRFSMGAANFSDLLGSVGGPSLKTLEELAKVSENSSEAVPLTPLSTSSSFDMQRPISDATVIGSHHGSSQVSLVDDDTTVVLKSEDMDGIGIPRSLTDLDRHPKTGKVSLTSEPHLRSILSPNGVSESFTRITLTEPNSRVAMTLKEDTSALVTRRVREALADATERGAQQLKLDKTFVEAILGAMEHRNKMYVDLKTKFDGMKRTSKQYIDGLTVAQTEYDKELKARRDAEAEVTRLRVLVSGQAARLTAQSGDVKQHKMREQLSKQLYEKLTGLEQDFSKLRMERDMTLMEMEELSASKAAFNNSEIPVSNLSRSLSLRLDKLKTQYQQELAPLTQQHEVLTREITELKAVRDVFLEETTVLNARNEELAQLSAQYARRMDAGPSSTKADVGTGKSSASFDKHRPLPSVAIAPPFALSGSHSSSYSDDLTDSSKLAKTQKHDATEFPTPLSKRNFMKWPGSKPKEAAHTHTISDNIPGKAKGSTEHVFQQYSLLRFTRCDHCGDKMWGSQVRCSLCNISVHGRCMNNVHLGCFQHHTVMREDTQSFVPPPTMFGRDLIEQVRSDAKGGPRQVPVIVEKCIEAIEVLALDYEGIYRKTGGSGQSKAITQLFERGDYLAFDLRDSDRFNDICSVTSVLKTYFRTLPVPLLTYNLHDGFMRAVEIKDAGHKHQAMMELVNKLPDEHYFTLRMLMFHLNRIMEHSEKNLMTARNLGVVFGPTLMRSRDPGAEFSDMAGKALSVEWLVENAPLIFNQPSAN